MADPDREDVYIRLRGERFAIPLVIIGLISIPPLAIPVMTVRDDFVRVFVLLQAAIIIAIQIMTIAGNVQRSIDGVRSKPQQPLVVRTLRWAYTARVLTSLVFVCVMTVGVVDRLGNPVLDWHTPVLQLCLLLLAIAWGFMDRRILWLERRVDNPEFMRMIEQLAALNTDRHHADQRRGGR